METSSQPSLTSKRVVPKTVGEPNASHIHESYSRGLMPMASRPFWTSIGTTAAVENDLDDLESTDERDAICLRVNTSVNISKNNNIVCLMETPAEHAKVIAKAVVDAIQKGSSGQCGIPMIDEDGHPRPVKIEVDASMVVDGAGNIVGNQDIVSQVLREKGTQKRQRVEEDDAESSQPAAKRQNSSQ